MPRLHWGPKKKKKSTNQTNNNNKNPINEEDAQDTQAHQYRTLLSCMKQIVVFRFYFGLSSRTKSPRARLGQLRS